MKQVGWWSYESPNRYWQDLGMSSSQYPRTGALTRAKTGN
jgi:hypothetical protein